jgi:arylsulfatase A-like enzyme
MKDVIEGNPGNINLRKDENSINRREFMKLTGISALSAAVMPDILQASPLPDDRPNILFIFPDEQRRFSMGFWNKPEYTGALNSVGDPVVTPTIDKLADEGIIFTHAVSTHPRCSPHRAMLLTGMHPEQNGVPVNCNTGTSADLKPDIECITDVLANEGYNTAWVGKTHWIKPVPYFDSGGNYVGTSQYPGGNYINGYDTYIPPGRDRHSVEYWYQAVRDIHKDAWCYSSHSPSVNGKKDGERHRPRIFTPENEANHIINYINNTAGQRDTSKPFCLFWSLNPPHMPYGSLNDVEEDVYNTYYRDKTISQLLLRDNVTTDKANGNVRYYFSNVTSVDKHIGRVLDALETAGLKDNTIIVFTSDHGDMMGSHDRMSKDIEYEESYGIPLIISFPKKLSHRIEDLLIGTPDLMPTLLGLAGMHDSIPSSVEGADYAPLLEDPNTTVVTKPSSALYLKDTEKKGVRTEKYTFVMNSSGNVVSLFNNIDDPYQMDNLNINSIPATDREFLLKELGYWLARANDKWYQERKFDNFIIYPVVSVTEKGRINCNTLTLDNFPNPFTSSTTIRYRLALTSPVTVSILDATGRKVKTLVSTMARAGQHNTRWNGRNEAGRLCSAGTYICELKTNREKKRMTMRLIR